MSAYLSQQKSEHEKLREADEKKVQGLQMLLVHSTKEYKTLQDKFLKLGKDRDDFIQFIAEKEQSFWNKRTEFLEATLNESEKKVQELQMSLAHSTQECETLQNKSRQFDKDMDELKLSIAEKEQSLVVQREEHEKQAQEMNLRIEKKVQEAKERAAETYERTIGEREKELEAYKREMKQNQEMIEHSFVERDSLVKKNSFLHIKIKRLERIIQE